MALIPSGRCQAIAQRTPPLGGSDPIFLSLSKKAPIHQDGSLYGGEGGI